MTMLSFELPFFITAVSFVGVLSLALAFTEPPRSGASFSQGNEILRLRTLGKSLTEPLLIWFFALTVVMYIFSHVPYVFGQPFIQEALRTSGLDGEAPIVSGIVTAVMMLTSVGTSLFALKLRKKLGLTAILLTAFSIQIALVIVLTLTNEMLAIAVLLLRMVPNSLSKPFISAHIQPLLDDMSRATYVSLQSFCGRLVFAGTLFFASKFTSTESQMSYSEIQAVLGWYSICGLLALVLLAVSACHLFNKGADL